MPKENSFSDSSNRSLTPDPEDEPDHLPQVMQDPPTPKPTTSILKAVAEQPRSRTVFTTSGTKSPGDRFRASVRKVIALHRTSSAIAGRRGAGAEPGIDPRRSSAMLQFGHIHQNCIIEICDYSSVRHSFGRMTNREFVQLMEDPIAHERESWVKVRWINIGGISWDVISALAIRHNLHPLALEDVLHQPRGGLLSKVDYYTQHLFIRVLSHTLAKGEDHEHDPLLYANAATNHSFTNLTNAVTGLPRSSSPLHFEREEEAALSDDELAKGNSQHRSSWFSMKYSGARSRFRTNEDVETMTHLSDKSTAPRSRSQTTSSADPRSSADRNQVRNAQAIEDLKKGQRVDVKIQPLCIFLLRDGTVITINPSPDLEFTAPIRDRLKHRDTGLRSSADPSLLVHGLLDLTVDRALEVVDEYHAKIIELEHDTLIHPKLRVVRDLHILQGDLILHKRTLAPIKTIVYGLRRYDVDRCAALLSDEERDPRNPAKGYMSHKSKIYLADVVDHMDYILTSLDMFANISENLINFTFNMASSQMSETMRRLTLATIIFLPLTILTGYFGMNFEAMWSVKHHSDVLFWKIAIPVLFVVIMSFMWPDLVRMYRHIQKQTISKRAGQTMVDRKHQ